MGSPEIPVKEIGELLDEVSGKVPKLIGTLLDTMYSADSGKRMGEAVGSFYKELVASGIPPEEALKMAKDYTLSFRDVASQFKGNKKE
ncbi:MAG: hypothetical protein WCR95_07415 [Eubacteriales bacterium]